MMKTPKRLICRRYFAAAGKSSHRASTNVALASTGCGSAPRTHIAEVALTGRGASR
jgi:hypothetical protein